MVQLFSYNQIPSYQSPHNLAIKLFTHIKNLFLVKLTNSWLSWLFHYNFQNSDLNITASPFQKAQTFFLFWKRWPLIKKIFCAAPLSLVSQICFLLLVKPPFKAIKSSILKLALLTLILLLLFFSIVYQRPIYIFCADVYSNGHKLGPTTSLRASRAIELSS